MSYLLTSLGPGDVDFWRHCYGWIKALSADEENEALLSAHHQKWDCPSLDRQREDERMRGDVCSARRKRVEIK